MPEGVGAEPRGRGDACPHQGAGGEPTAGRGIGAGSQRGSAGQQEVPTSRGRPSMLEIGGEGVSDLLDEGEDARVVGCARADAHPALVPVEILSAEGCDFMRPDAEAGQEQQDRVIPQGLGTAACTGGEGPLHLLDRQATWERGMRRLAWGRHCGF